MADEIEESMKSFGDPRGMARGLAFSEDIVCSRASGAQSVRVSDGMDVRFRVAGCGEPTLLFVHGWSCDRSFWHNQIDQFAQSHSVVAIDLAGHGESGFGRKEWTIAAFGGDVCAVADALQLRKVILIGHSMGGHVAVEAAKLLRDRVIAIIAVDTFVDVEHRMGKSQRDQLLRSLRADYENATAHWVRSNLFANSSDPKLVEQIVSKMSSAPSDVGLSAQEYLLHYNEAKALVHTKVPVRLINADDCPTNLETLRRYKLDVELAILPGVGHFLMLEAPNEFNRLLDQTISDLLRRA